MIATASCPPDSQSPGHDSAANQLAILVIEATDQSPLGPKIVFANETASEITGYDLASLIGSPLGLVYDHDDLESLLERLPLIAGSSEYFWMDRLLLCNGGGRRPVRWTIRPTQRDDATTGYFTLTVAETIHRQQELALEEPEDTEPATEKPAASRIPEELAELDAERDQALALAAGGVAHDFKNALQAIKSNLEMANVVAGANPRLGEYLSDAHLALGDAETLARQMLDFTRGAATRRCVFDLTESLERVSRLSTAGTLIRCRLRAAPDLRPIEGDPDQIYQVLHNLFINACQAMPGGGTIDLSAGNIDLDHDTNRFSVPRGEYSVISVRDRGCGIEPENLQRIFERNFSTKENGCGFGLASCRAIVEKHGGAIRVASHVGVGTEFLVFLPSSATVVLPARLPQADRLPEDHSRPVAGNARVLVVEDQHGVRKATCGMLRHLGYDTLVAETGEEAVSAYQRALDSDEPVHAVLLDMTLPGGLDGMDVFAELRRFDEEAIVVATSGYFEDGPSEELFAEGFAGVIAKPFSMDSLAVTIHEALSR